MNCFLNLAHVLKYWDALFPYGFETRKDTQPVVGSHTWSTYCTGGIHSQWFCIVLESNLWQFNSLCVWWTQELVKEHLQAFLSMSMIWAQTCPITQVHAHMSTMSNRLTSITASANCSRNAQSGHMHMMWAPPPVNVAEDSLLSSILWTEFFSRISVPFSKMSWDAHVFWVWHIVS